MRVSIVGAGPAGLYLACLLKRSSVPFEVTVIEQNARDATFGFGLALSQHALETLRRDDEETWAAIWPALEFWTDSVVSLNGETVRIDGMGYAGIGRLRLLQILQSLAGSLGIVPEYGRVLRTPEELAGSDLIAGADGANSVVRSWSESDFGTETSQFTNRFAWYGAQTRFDALTHTFVETPSGAFNAHHHPHAPDMSTFVVETNEATFFRCGFDRMSQPDAQAHCERIFAGVLRGAPLVSNKSVWRRFPCISNRHWSYGNRVLLGDALHTAHFSIGSGTRLAMEDALSLARALIRCNGDVRGALAEFEAARAPPAGRVVAAANSSARWYEDFPAHMRLPLMEFAMSYITRSGRVTADQLRRRSGAFMLEYDRWRAVVSKPV